MPNHIQLSTEGSDRATAYNISNKIARRGDDLIVGWLDAPASKGEPVRIRLGVCAGNSGQLNHVINLGGGIDNHCGPAITLDSNGRLHIIVGAHHGDFLYRFSDDPSDTSSWSSPDPVGPHHSYPSLVIDTSGTLHLAYREKGDRWQLQYTRRRPGSDWETPTVIAQSPTLGYNHFMHSLTIGPTGRLHLTFQFHYSETGINTDCLGKGLAHIVSKNGGDSWTNEGASCDLPLTIHSTHFITSCFDDETASLRTGTHVLDRNDHPWLFASLPNPGRGVVIHQTNEGWSDINLGETIPDLDLSLGKSTAITYDKDDRVHLLISTHPKVSGLGWYDPGNELFHIVFDLDGKVTSHTQLSENDPDRAHWLPSIEQWDWSHPRQVGEGGHWYTYTSGIAAGMLSDPNYNDTLYTEVYLAKL